MPLVLAVLLLVATPALAGVDELMYEGLLDAPLPPEIPWSGKSRELLRLADDPWATPFEASGGTDSPSYDDTVAWLRRLVDASPRLEMVSIGTSPEGREIWMVIASAQGAATPEALHANGRPIVLAQAGIHSGEIDGKDAGMMLLRDLTVGGGRAALLERANLLFVPILNVDGHERRSPHGRINQRGPEHTGWRTNAANLNLNRDYAKLDTPEVRAVIAAIEAWEPDLYLDLHVTDGVDLQYDVTWGFAERPTYSPAISEWLAGVLRPAVNARLEAMGHVPGPFLAELDPFATDEPVRVFPTSPRYSDGYGDARHLPTILVENHSLKSFERRVLGTYVFLEAVLRTVGERADGLEEAIREDRARRPDPVPVAWEEAPGTRETWHVLGIRAEKRPSPVTGGEITVWTGEPIEFDLPVYYQDVPAATVERPAAYWIPPAWAAIAERLRLHGVEVEETGAPRTLTVERLRLVDPQLEEEPFEGHLRVSAGVTPERAEATFPAGSFRVSTDQPLGDLAILLLEPQSQDSLFQWGFFHPVLQRTEYVEGYVMAPLAERMLEADPALRQEFERKLAENPEFAADPAARLDWFYRRTPWFDDTWRLYPVAREPGD